MKSQTIDVSQLELNAPVSPTKTTQELFELNSIKNISHIPFTVQAKLVRVSENRVIRRPQSNVESYIKAEGALDRKKDTSNTRQVTVSIPIDEMEYNRLCVHAYQKNEDVEPLLSELFLDHYKDISSELPWNNPDNFQNEDDPTHNNPPGGVL